LQREQAEAFGVRTEQTPAPPVVAEEVMEAAPEMLALPQARVPTVMEQLVMFGASRGELPKRKVSRQRTATAAPSDQLVLFAP
jgi:hypothetical protein